MVSPEKYKELETAVHDYMEAALADLHLIVKESPYMTQEGQHQFVKLSNQMIGIDNIIWAGREYGVPECPPEYKRLITERCVGKTAADIIRQYKAGSVYPKMYAEVDTDPEEMKKQLLKDHWPAIYIFREAELRGPRFTLPFMHPMIPGKVLHSGADFQIVEYASYITGIAAEELWDFLFTTPEGQQMMDRARRGTGLEWTPASNPGTPRARSAFGTEKVRYGELSSGRNLQPYVIFYASLGAVLQDQPGYQDEVVFKLGRYQDTTPEELLQITNHAAFSLAKHLWTKQYVKGLDEYWPELPGVAATEESNQRGSKIGPTISKAMKTDPLLVKYYEKAKAAFPKFFGAGSRVLTYGFTLQQLIDFEQSSAPERILRLRSGDLYEFAAMLYQKKLVPAEKRAKIQVSSITSQQANAVQELLSAPGVRAFLRQFPTEFSIKDLMVFDSTYGQGGKRPEFPEGIHSITQLKLGADLRVAVKRITGSQRAFFDSPNFAFQLIWTGLAQGVLPNTEAGAEREYRKGFAAPELSTYVYGPNTHFDVASPDPDGNMGRVHVKDGVVLAWIRFTVISDKECVVIDEIQTDMNNKEYDFLLGYGNRFMDGWEHLIMKYFLNYARKKLGYQRIYAPTPAAKVGRYKAMATKPILNNLYSTLWNDFGFSKTPETEGDLAGFRLLDEHRASILDIRSLQHG